MRRLVSPGVALLILLSVFLSCGTSRAAGPTDPGGTAKEEERLSSFVNVAVNSTVIVGALMTEAMTGAMGNAAIGMTEGVAEALDNTGSAPPRGADMRQEMSRNVSAMVREMIETMLPKTREELGTVIAGLSPDQRKDLLADIGDESYDRLFEAIRKADFGLPRLTERLSVNDVLGYLDIARKQDPRFMEILEPMNKLKPPRLFAEMKRAGGEKEEAPAAKAAPVPPTIDRLPAAHLFPPGGEATISLPGDKELNLFWEAKPGPDKDFANSGILVQHRGSGVKTPSGGMTLYPEKGRVTATMKNLEAFPVTVEISAGE
jgi:hypothetical protein